MNKKDFLIYLSTKPKKKWHEVFSGTSTVSSTSSTTPSYGKYPGVTKIRISGFASSDADGVYDKATANINGKSKVDNEEIIITTLPAQLAYCYAHAYESSTNTKVLYYDENGYLKWKTESSGSVQTTNAYAEVTIKRIELYY